MQRTDGHWLTQGALMQVFRLVQRFANIWPHFWIDGIRLYCVRVICAFSVRVGIGQRSYLVTTFHSNDDMGWRSSFCVSSFLSRSSATLLIGRISQCLRRSRTASAETTAPLWLLIVMLVLRCLGGITQWFSRTLLTRAVRTLFHSFAMRFLD